MYGDWFKIGRMTLLVGRKVNITIESSQSDYKRVSAPGIL